MYHIDLRGLGYFFPRSSALFLVLACLSGCASRPPGETFSAGYIFADKQGKVTHDFVVRNTTSKPVKIYRIEKSCTCASFKLGKYQLAPREATTLTFDVDIPPTYMQKFATCILKTDHPRFRDWAYNIRFTSLPFAVADPADLNLGCFAVGGKNLKDVQHATLDLFADSKVELTQTNFSMPDEIELSSLSSPEVRRLQRGVWNTRYQISMGLSPMGREAVLHGAQSGLVTKTVDLRAGASRSRQWQYSVYWQARSPLECCPSYVTFGNLLDEKDDHCRKVVISCTTNGMFRIVSIRSQPQDIRFESSVDTVDDAPQHRMKFTAPRYNGAQGQTPGGHSRFLSGTIQFLTTHKLRPVVEIPWSAMLDPSVKPRSTANPPKSSSERGL